MQGPQPVSAASLWPSLKAGDLQALRTAEAALSASDDGEWLLKYGCALLPLPLRRAGCGSDSSGASSGSGSAAPDIRARLLDLSLMLVCLDQWDFKVHRCGYVYPAAIVGPA